MKSFFKKKHHWVFERAEWGSYGMSLEKFDIYKCTRCGKKADRLSTRVAHIGITKAELLINSTYPEHTVHCDANLDKKSSVFVRIAQAIFCEA